MHRTYRADHDTEQQLTPRDTQVAHPGTEGKYNVY